MKSMDHNIKLLAIIYRIIFVIGILLIGFGCADKKDYQEEYTERILLQLLTQPAPNPQQKCENAFIAKSTCLSQTSTQTAATDSLSLAVVYYVIFNQVNPNTTDLSATCVRLLSDNPFSRFTQAAADCFFACKQNIWTNLNANNKCSVPYVSIYSIALENNRNLDCIQSCQAVTNTPSL